MLPAIVGSGGRCSGRVVRLIGSVSGLEKMRRKLGHIHELGHVGVKRSELA